MATDDFPAARLPGQQLELENQGICSVFCPLCLPYSCRRRNSILIYAPVHLVLSLQHLTSIQKHPAPTVATTITVTSQDRYIAGNPPAPGVTVTVTVSATFIQHHTSLHDARNRTFTLTYENDNHSGRVDSAVEHVAPRRARPCGTGGIAAALLRLSISSKPRKIGWYRA